VTLLAPLGLAALLLSVPIVALHMLTPHRPPSSVSSLLHWEGMRDSITAAEPWQRLRLSALLFLQLAAVALFGLALANPATVTQAELAEHTVFIVDASGSMSAIDGSPDRLADAIDRAKELRGELPEGGLASLVVASVNPATLLAEDGDAAVFDRAVESISTTAGAADYDAAFALAESLRSPDRRTGFVLISDGALDPVQQRLAPLGTRFEPVGRDDTNRAITDLSATAGPGGLQVRVTVESTGGADATQQLRIAVDGGIEESRELTIPAGEVVEEVFEVSRGTEVTASLEGEDLIAADDRRFVAAAIPGTVRARIHGEGSIFLDELFAAIPGVETSVAPGEAADFEVYAGTPVPGDISVPFIAIDVPGGVPGVTPSGRTDDPIATSVADDPLLAGVDVSRLAIVDAQVLTVDGGDVLLAAPGAPLLVRGSSDGVPFFYLAFTLEQSNLPVDVAFPVIGSRMVAELTVSEGATAALTVGDRIPVGGNGGTSIDPDGDRHVTTIGATAPIADLPGFWTVERQGREPVVVAVNADIAESAAAPHSDLAELRPAGEDETATAADVTTSVAQSLLPWVAAGLFLVLGIEIVASRRRRGVGRRQWRLGLLLRVIIVGLLVLALVDPSFNAADDTVMTVFVADASDSLGGSVDQVAAWIGSAIDDAGDGRWAVVEVGADARLVTPEGTTPYRSSGAIDGSSTNLGRGLRLGAALLSGASKERIVLVSDGRDNDGDLTSEIDRLTSLGVVVDVHTVAGEPQTDAAVASIDAPDLVAEGEAFDTVVEVRSSVAGPATVELTSSGFVTRQAVDLEPGSNLVSFTTTAGSRGTQELQAGVSLDGDARAENDVATTGVSIEGPGSVLIVEGIPDAGSPLAGALTARGLVVHTIAPPELPGVDGLAVHQALVLADVRAGDLAEEQVAAVRSFVSDLGRGLVVVGGIASYGLGDYFGTELEALLPVSSEAVDPEREAPVAEVLLIDTSESMGACHCAGDGTEEEGPNKTDIAKAATMRAFDSLDENDEIGVLAFSAAERWVVELQPSPSRQRVEDAIGGLRPFGETRIIPALRDAADALRESNRALKHIVLFTDGFTTELEESGNAIGLPTADVKGGLVEMAADLAAEGITVSVVGTGEGAIPALERVAEAGNGRFYPGRNLDEIPEIFVEESRLASRAYVNEGEFYPTVTSTSPAVRDLASAPALFGFVATTAKPTADVQLQVGELADPLLATWRVGLGKATAWTSDGGQRWASEWATWDGFADFWSAVVRDTFPLSGSAGERIDASISGELLTIALEGSEPWPSGTSPVARVSYPDGTSEEVRLERRSDFEFEAVVPARQTGVYAIGVGIEGDHDRAAVLSTVASRSFGAEYLPGEPDPELLVALSEATAGRGEITAAEAFDGADLPPGSKPFDLGWLSLLLAALLWPVDVALRRVRLHRRAQPAPPRPPAAPPTRPTQPAAGGRR
jgi:Mg-chelatase subunit ChlD